MVNLINLHFMLKETFQLSFNNYIFKVNSSKESKKKKVKVKYKKLNFNKVFLNLKILD